MNDKVGQSDSRTFSWILANELDEKQRILSVEWSRSDSISIQPSKVLDFAYSFQFLYRLNLIYFFLWRPFAVIIPTPGALMAAFRILFVFGVYKTKIQRIPVPAGHYIFSRSTTGNSDCKIQNYSQTSINGHLVSCTGLRKILPLIRTVNFSFILCLSLYNSPAYKQKGHHWSIF